ncbi:tetratricopeptide repeat protein [Streptomyces sp. NPDC023723]|uniref:tetratricopeptide repeat protein n=1 Tax=Streptomyces sp. NPDC023723 TaxID=3154323 RepID=UPI0033F7AF67
MARLSRDKKRDHPRVGHPAAPIDVRVAGAGTGTVGGVPVAAVPGEEIQQTVLNRLQGLARAAGRPVLATVHDERIGYVVALRVDPDGSSHLMAEPARTDPPPATARAAHERPNGAMPAAPGPAPAPAPVPAGDPSPTFRLRTLPETGPTAGPAAGPPAGPPTAPPAGQARAFGAAPGTVAPPTGEFGPPPRMDGPAAPAGPPRTSTPGAPPVPPAPPAPATPAAPPPPPAAVESPSPKSPSVKPVSAKPPSVKSPKLDVHLGSDADLVADTQPTPARGFDAVAEAVLGDGPITAPGDSTAPAVLAEPTARVNEAVRDGRTEEAAQLAEQAVAEATGALGADHPEILRLRELTAYIAYLSGDPVHALHTALDVARVHHRAGDAEAAYGTVRSAATAWRAVRDPAEGLELGHELISLWTALAVEAGPAADDIEELESARARMGRLTERARALAE